MRGTGGGAPGRAGGGRPRPAAAVLGQRPAYQGVPLPLHRLSRLRAWRAGRRLGAWRTGRAGRRRLTPPPREGGGGVRPLQVAERRDELPRVRTRAGRREPRDQVAGDAAGLLFHALLSDFDPPSLRFPPHPTLSTCAGAGISSRLRGTQPVRPGPMGVHERAERLEHARPLAPQPLELRHRPPQRRALAGVGPRRAAVRAQVAAGVLHDLPGACLQPRWAGGVCAILGGRVVLLHDGRDAGLEPGRVHLRSGRPAAKRRMLWRPLLKAPPAELILAGAAPHVRAAAVLLNVRAALGAGLGALRHEAFVGICRPGPARVGRAVVASADPPERLGLPCAPEPVEEVGEARQVHIRGGIHRVGRVRRPDEPGQGFHSARNRILEFDGVEIPPPVRPVSDSHAFRLSLASQLLVDSAGYFTQCVLGVVHNLSDQKVSVTGLVTSIPYTSKTKWCIIHL